MAVKWQLELNKEMADTPEKVNHLIIPPSIVRSSGVSGWYVKFYAYNVDKGKKVRVRIAVSGKTEAQKLKDANFIIKSVTDAFDNGAYISAVKRTQDVVTVIVLTFEQSVQAFLDFKFSTLKKRSKETYQTWSNQTMPFFKQKGLAQLFFKEITKKNIRDFFDFLITEKQLSAKTYNDLKNFLSCVYNHHIERENIDKNLIVGFIKPLKVVSGKHVPYTFEQARNIRDLFTENEDRQTTLFLSFCFYTLARPREEIRLLKVSDIVNDTIYFKPENAKTTENSYIVIPEPLEKIIEAYGLRNYPPDYYIFSRNQVPGIEPTGPAYFYIKHRTALSALGYTDRDYDLYSWKHTAVCQLFLARVDIDSIRQQCRHTDIKQTIQYLKNLGMIKNSELKAKFPEL